MILVTGGAGFIGSHLVDALVAKGKDVRVIDNLSLGRLEFISKLVEEGKIEFIKGDLRNFEDVKRSLKDVEIVYHFAANPDVKLSVEKPLTHFEDNILGTFNVLEAARQLGTVKKIVFASSSTVYGDAKKMPTPEDHILEPISVYGASKVAGEALLSAYAYSYGIKGISIRYANIVGPRLRHGAIYNFINFLVRDSSKLPILGDGTQRKSYLYVSDAVSAAILLEEKVTKLFDTYNVGNVDWITVREIAEIVINVMGVNAKIVSMGGTPDGRGWPGDVKFMILNISKIRELGWKPSMSSREAVERTAKELIKELGVKV
ncbi:MAG TPA: SDR family NAD(P)-dependent oxidoreductase [Thermoproteales archaeon]|nr:SDR family NAD(P)-dependent oxidoreductase [Thermoproteales archaeon]